MSLEQSKAVGGEVVHLSRRQKRDLLELAAAGVISTIFFAAPVFLLRDAPSGPAAPPVRQTASVLPGDRVQIATADVTAPVSTPALQPVSRRLPSRMRRAAVTAPPASALASTRSRAPIGRRIARLFAGDGSYPVQPFPMIPTARR